MTDNNNYAEAHARFEANVQLADAEMKQAGLDPETGFAPGQEHPSQQPTPAVNVDLLAEADRLQAARDETGRRPYVEDQAYRNKVEQLRQQAFGADPAQQPQVSTPPRQEPVEPQGTPADRSAADLNERLDSGDIVEPGEVEPETWGRLTANYRLDDLLPRGFGVGALEAEQLRAARYAGVPESQIRTIVAQLVKAQQQ